jgi:hypothetical protein
MVVAYRLFYDVFVPGNTTELANARAIFVRQLLTRSEVEERELTEGWSPRFVRGLVGQGDDQGLVGRSAFPMEMQRRMDDGGTTTVQLMRDLAAGEQRKIGSTGLVLALAEEAQERARQETDRQRQILADARAAERVVEQLRENRAATAAREEARRQQNLMDEAARKPS